MSNILYAYQEIEPSRRPRIRFEKLTALQVFEASFDDGAIPDSLPLMAKLRIDSISGRMLNNSKSGLPIVSDKSIVRLSEISIPFDSDDEVILCGRLIRYLQPPMKIGSTLTFGEFQPNSNILFRCGNIIYRKVNNNEAQKLTTVDDFEKLGPIAAEKNIRKHPDSLSLETFNEFQEIIIVYFLPSEAILKAMEG